MEDPERSEIRAHLDRNCQTCTAGLREALAFTYSMGALVDGPEPPRALRGRVSGIAETGARRSPAMRTAASRRLLFLGRPLTAWQGLALLAACLALAFVPAILWRRAVSESQARQAVAATALADERRSEARLRDQLAKLEGGSSMRIDPIVPLELERGAPGGTVRHISIPSGAGAIVLALPQDLVRQASAAELKNASGAAFHSISPIAAGGSDATGLTIDARLLPAGRYSLELRAGEHVIARFPFAVDRH
jgi:hypothetical protein